MKQVMLGNEAIARGAYEAGCHVAAAYPGTPSTEILKNISKYKEISSEWSVNEKVAAEVCIGASMAGGRALAAMKHFGLNVASDAVFPAVYEGATGGLVIICADDPGMNSSGTEPDSRNFAPHMKIPMIEPADSQECLDFVKLAFDLSEEFDTPFLIRTSTRVNHGSTVVTTGERKNVPIKTYAKNIMKNTNIPAVARNKHQAVEERILKLRDYSNTSELNRIEMYNKKIGIICNGISYQYAKEVFGEDASYLKIGFSYPMPDEKIKAFAASVETLYIIEELDPYMEDFVKSLGIPCVGKDKLPRCLELTPDIVREGFGLSDTKEGYSVDINTPVRSAVFCAGCPHRGIYHEVSKYVGKIVATGDIGCYALNILPPFSVTDTMIDMGGSITAGIGFDKIKKLSNRDLKTFSFIGDSTFFHSGITGLIDAVYNKAAISLFILDNSTTAMTGHQGNPVNGKTLMGEQSTMVDIEQLVKGCGVDPKNIRVIDPYDLMSTRAAVKEAFEATELFVVISKQPCALLKSQQEARKGIHCQVNQEKCKNCKVCIAKTGCPALEISNGNVKINKVDCNGCTICQQICPFDAIERIGG
ncbi:indolepyruvate ferredoxin oxidoreductase subunit alpha [Anaerotignum sp.]|uniref:indolepyruvate ferredoxin oxidoreductase subunit alpha n=1 Tax=Anaerotignum sp. TaxID=2039241 RepID=UPI00271524C8|nr:indolepyruvate ferredoxin oxidoreductase subunit alpha [Anaerotignum sp.]